MDIIYFKSFRASKSQESQEKKYQVSTCENTRTPRSKPGSPEMPANAEAAAVKQKELKSMPTKDGDKDKTGPILS